MDTFVDSSWYFFRYCSPGYEEGPFRREDVERWPVSQYTGGVEHAILHLLYARFFTKAMYDAGMVPFVEPFGRMMNQGQVIYGGASMSKSKGNVVEPMPLVERWGADSMRLTMLFANPFEDDIDWKLIAGDADHRPGVHHWLGRVFAAVGEAAAGGGEEPGELVRLTHRTIKGVAVDIERFHFNVAISKLMVLTNGMRSALDAGGAARGAAEAFVQMLAPFAPFAAEELWREVLGHGESVHVSSWPVYDEALAAEDTVTLIVQVDGKVRDKIEVPADARRGTRPRAGARVREGPARDRRSPGREGDRPRAEAGQLRHARVAGSSRRSSQASSGRLRSRPSIERPAGREGVRQHLRGSRFRHRGAGGAPRGGFPTSVTGFTAEGHVRA